MKNKVEEFLKASRNVGSKNLSLVAKQESPFSILKFLAISLPRNTYSLTLQDLDRDKTCLVIKYKGEKPTMALSDQGINENEESGRLKKTSEDFCLYLQKQGYSVEGYFFNNNFHGVSRLN